MGKTYDFSGWATKANMLCSDGRVIMKDAFAECDGMTVPLVWNHQHNRPEEVLGHALLENREEGVYAYGIFNDTESGQNAKLLVQHGDVDRLSIYANKLKQRGSDVIHGVIREVSLVLAGANPGAQIESVIMHGDDSSEEGYIRSGEFIENAETMMHAETEEKGDDKSVAEETKKTEAKPESEKTIEDVLKTFNEEQMKVLNVIVGMALEDAGVKPEKSGGTTAKEEKKDEKPAESKEVKHSDDTAESEKDDDAETGDEKTIKDVYESMTDEQKTVVNVLVGKALEDSKKENEKVEHNEGGNDDMKVNVFDQETENKDTLTHSDMVEILSDAKKIGSLKEAVIQHGIEQIDYLFPDAQAIDAQPGFIKRDDTWVADFMNSVHKTPFSRIKSIFADLTEADARAKGYIKGNMKAEEFFSLIKRITTPTTIYKKQAIDRDDVVDITDFDVVAWLKTEMRMMLDEEIARAALVGDGRSSSSNDKINEQNVRPIWTDEDLYTVKAEVAVTGETTDDQKAKGFIKACIKSRKNYKGSGNPNMYITEDMLTNCLLLEDLNGRVIYDTIDKLATALRVRKIVPVPVMDDLTRIVGSNTHTLAGIYVNPVDYNIGADRGGAVNMFDDFDIDYNKQKYLIETRCSGALTKPYSAVAIELVQATD